MHRHLTEPINAGRLPRPLTPFVDRTEELLAVTRLLSDADCRLLTLIGPGGIGKTRLALEVAATHAARLEDEQDDLFVHGVFFVNVQSLGSLDLLPAAVAAAVNAPPAGAEAPQTQLCNYLSNKAMLIVLDGFDELLAATAAGENNGYDFLTGLLHGAPYVKLLVTSREALNLQEEWLYPLSGMAYPADGQHGGAGLNEAELEAYGAVRLFLQCARRVRPDFDLLKERTGVARICQLVEGMPLALELAATWVKTLDCTAIAAEIEQNIGFLATNLRNVPERHRSVNAIFAQTWQMLSEPERAVFKRLAIFRGGFRRGAAEAVAGAALPVLSALVNKSLLRWEPNGRYQLHGLLRQFAHERLGEDSDEAASLLDAHAAYFADFLNRRRDEIMGARQREVLQEIGAELGNIRSAWAHAVQRRRIDWLGQATYTLYQFFDMQGRYGEASEAFEPALAAFAAIEPTPEVLKVEAHLLVMQGWNYIRLGRYDAAAALFHRSETFYHDHGLESPRGFATDPTLGLALLATVQGNYETAIALATAGYQHHNGRHDLHNLLVARYVLASAYFAQGDYEASRDCAQDAYRLAKESGNRWMMGYVLNLLGEVSRVLGHYEEARQYYQQCFFVREEFNDPEGMAAALNLLARTAWLQADYGEAKRLYGRSLAIYQQINDRGALASVLLGLGETALMEEAYDTAQSYLNDALQIATDIDWRPLTLAILVSVAHLYQRTNRAKQAVPLLVLVGSHPLVRYETKDAAGKLLTAISRTLPATQLAAAHARGEAMNLVTAIAATLATLAFQPAPGPNGGTSPRPPAPADQPLIEPLTSRELEVLGLVAQGLSNQQIANELILSVGTVKFYTGQIYGKLGVNSRTQAVAQARSLRLLVN
jgi:predicted ATPase/DNA-binding CsgD family transcriptional regulator